MPYNLTEFDVTDTLDSEEAISEYLTQVLTDADNEELIRAICYIAKARGIEQVVGSRNAGT